jgi:hypothetical protein
MKSDVLVMTIDFGKNHFNAIILDNQLKLISPAGTMITFTEDNRVTIRKEAEQAINKLIDFFKH